MSTEFPSKNAIAREWHVLDAKELSSASSPRKAAMMLMGKTKPTYTPFLDTGDHVIVINAEKVKLTGRKKNERFTATSPGIPVD